MKKKNDNKKKIIIIIIAILLLIAIGVIVALFFMNKDKDKNNTTTTTAVVENVTITFNSNGGETIENMIVKKGEEVTLPIPSYEGYVFKYWSDTEDVIMNEIVTFDKDTTLNATWEKITKETKTMKISFDSKGGSKVSAITLACEDDSVTIKSFPKNPTKSGYTFRAWEDKHGKAILAGAKLTCDDVKLYAAWDENEKPATSSEPTCPDGYTLTATDTLCVRTTSPSKTCPNGTKYSEKADKCYTYSGEPTITCTQYQGYDGRKFDDTHGHTGCAYGDRASYPTSRECSGHGFAWSDYSPSPHCWAYIVFGETNWIRSCPDGTKYTGSSELGGTANNGCYTIKDYTMTCPNGYEYNKAENKCYDSVKPNFN